MKSIIMGTMEDGTRCVYGLPPQIKTAGQMQSLIYDYNYSPKQREELQGQPKLLGFNGPMFNGYRWLASTGEKPSKF